MDVNKEEKCVGAEFQGCSTLIRLNDESRFLFSYISNVRCVGGCSLRLFVSKLCGDSFGMITSNLQSFTKIMKLTTNFTGKYIYGNG